MSEHANPGDTIEITYSRGDWLGRRFTVIERPSDKPYKNAPGDAWFAIDGDSPKFFGKDNYRIVRRAAAEENVEQRLKEQRDANLKSFFPSIFQLNKT